MLLNQALSVLAAIVMFGKATVQDDFSNPITCYSCFDRAVNTSCAHPANPHNNPVLRKTECRNGVCIKWTRYRQGVLYLERTCSSLLNIHISLIHGVCRVERDGNGYLCMCGKHLCNAAPQNRAGGTTVVFIMAALFIHPALYIVFAR